MKRVFGISVAAIGVIVVLGVAPDFDLARGPDRPQTHIKDKI